jgi:WXG100 family type VII secretion target
MSNILAAPQELRDHAGAVVAQAQNAQSDFTAMKHRLESLSNAFQGQAATAFQGHWNEWHTSANGLVQALDGLGRFLKAAADAIEETDTALANGLK